MHRRAGSVSRPLPLLRYAEPVGGGEGGTAGRVFSRGPERGREVTLANQSRELESHLILARKICGLESHLSSASYFGKSLQQAIWASLSGMPFRHLNLAGFYCK
jgi:hypothetical protein